MGKSNFFPPDISEAICHHSPLCRDGLFLAPFCRIVVFLSRVRWREKDRFILYIAARWVSLVQRPDKGSLKRHGERRTNQRGKKALSKYKAAEVPTPRARAPGDTTPRYCSHQKFLSDPRTCSRRVKEDTFLDSATRWALEDEKDPSVPLLLYSSSIGFVV